MQNSDAINTKYKDQEGESRVVHNQEEHEGHQNEGQQLIEEEKEEKQSSEERDIILDIGKVKVEEIKLKVEELKAKISVSANVGQLVNIQVGADVCIDKVDVEIRGVEAEAHLKVKLKRVQEILTRALDTIDKNADVLKNLNLGNGMDTGSDEYNNSGNPSVLEKVGDSVEGMVDSARQKVGGAVENIGDTIADVAPHQEEEENRR